MPFIEKDIWLKHKDNADFALIGIDRDEPLDKVLAFAKSTGVTYPLGLDPGADIFAKYALHSAPPPFICSLIIQLHGQSSEYY